MKQTIGVTQFHQAFYTADRAKQFSWEALNILYDYFEECDPDMDLDVIAICCEYAEMTPEDFCKAYGIDTDGLDENTMFDAAVEFAQEITTLVGTTCDGCLIYCTEF